MAKDKLLPEALLVKKLTELSLPELKKMVAFLDSKDLNNPDPDKRAKLKFIHKFLKVLLTEKLKIVN